jgi:hypothetical protein
MVLPETRPGSKWDSGARTGDQPRGVTSCYKDSRPSRPKGVILYLARLESGRTEPYRNAHEAQGYGYFHTSLWPFNLVRCQISEYSRI